jgi:hypothetical protein
MGAFDPMPLQFLFMSTSKQSNKISRQRKPVVILNLGSKIKNTGHC